MAASVIWILHMDVIVLSNCAASCHQDSRANKGNGRLDMSRCCFCQNFGEN